jgi:diguanylate cyclase (GGDEF)-like protein
VHVLIAEDNAVSRKVLETRLNKWGYEVVCANDGAEAWKLLQQDNAPSLVILDWMMPHVDGVELCRKIREIPTESYTYIILLTAKDQKEDIIEAMQSGADDYIVKPPHPSELQARLRAGQRIIELQERLIKTQEALKAQASHDGLTGLWNRPAIFDVLQREIARAKRSKKPVAIAMADLDDFKHINDTYGHVTGDAVLKEFAARLVSNTRPYDGVGRYGGEEFLIVLPGSDEQGALTVAERIRSGVCKKAMHHSGDIIPLTVSLGVAALYPSVESTVESFINVADQALYRAKAQGKNCSSVGNWDERFEKKRSAEIR